MQQFIYIYYAGIRNLMFLLNQTIKLYLQRLSSCIKSFQPSVRSSFQSIKILSHLIICIRYCQFMYYFLLWSFPFCLGGSFCFKQNRPTFNLSNLLYVIGIRYLRLQLLPYNQIRCKTVCALF